jgi:polysaccharide biosynthesis protein PslG
MTLLLLLFIVVVHAMDYGINVHRPQGDLAAKLMDKVKESGIQWVRIDVSWDEIESQQGNLNWNSADDSIRAASDRGLKIYASLQGAPKWANGGKDSRVQARNVSDWASFCQKAAERYDGKHEVPKVDFFGIWNEPDGNGLGEKGDSQDKKLNDYVKNILQPASKAIKNVRSDAKIAAPDLASKPDFLEKVLDKAKDSIDIVTVHKYSDKVATVVQYVQNIANMVKRKGGHNKDLWLTETGWSTKTNKGCWTEMVDEKSQAQLMSSLMQNLKKANTVQKVFIYELLDDDHKGACQWGILKSNLNEKASFREMKNLIHGHHMEIA